MPISDMFKSIKLDAEQMKKVEELLEQHADDTMGYLVDANDLHRLLAIAYPLESKKDDPEIRLAAARSIRKMFQKARHISLGDISMITELLVAAGISPEDEAAKNAGTKLDETAKEKPE